MAEGNATNIAIDIFASPGEAFAAIKQRPRPLLPLALLLAGVAAVTFIYLNGVDMQWFFEQQLGADPNVTEAQAEQAAATIASLPQAGVAAAITVVGVLGLAVTLLLQALYLKIVTVFTKDGILYKQWFGLNCWCSMPSLLAYLATLANLLTNDIALMPQASTNPLTFANLLGLESIGSGWLDQFVMNFGPLAVWSLALMVFGYKAFTGKGVVTAAAIVLAPTVIIASLAFAF